MAGFHPDTDRLFDDAVDAMKKLGAEIVDPADVPGIKDLGDPEFEVMLFEFKAGLEAYFAALGPSAPVKTLAELIAFNDANREREMPYFGQETLLKAQEKGPLSTPAYLKALETCGRLSRREGLDAVLDPHRLDAIVAPTGGPGLGHRPRERRPLHRRQLDAGRGRGLPQHQRADGIRVRTAGGPVVRRARLERAASWCASPTPSSRRPGIASRRASCPPPR